MAHRPPHTDEQRAEVVPNFRPFLGKLEIPEAGICDMPCSVYKINNEWRKFFISAMLVLDQPDIWDSADADEVLAARRQVREFVGMAPCGCDGTQGSVVNNLTVALILHLHYEELFAVGGLDAVAPDRPDTTFDTDSSDVGEEMYRRQLALCWAVYDYIYTAIEAGMFNAALGDVAIIVNSGLIAFFVSPMSALVYYFSIAAAEELVNLVASIPENVEAVACCMLEGLSGQAITEANFAAALDNCGFTFLSDQYIIAEIISSQMDDQGNYLAFVASLGAYMNATSVLGDCPCTPIACQSDFTIDRGGWAARGGMAVYLAGIGWDNSPGGAFNHMIQIDFTHDVDWNVGLVRVLLDNQEEEDVTVLFKLRDAAQAALQSVTVVIPPGQQAAVALMDDTIDFRILHVVVRTTDFPEDNINAIITGFDVITGDCVFPEQPVE